MTANDVIDGILEHEGSGFTDDPFDHGGPTRYGIAAATLGEWRGYGRVATREEVKALTEAEARQIYQARYIDRPGFTRENIPHEALRAALIDEGVNAGPAVAIRHLQEAMGVTVDGILGPETQTALRTYLTGHGLLLKVVRLRCLRYARIVQSDPRQSRFLAGWVARAFDCLEMRT